MTQAMPNATHIALAKSGEIHFEPHLFVGLSIRYADMLPLVGTFGTPWGLDFSDWPPPGIGPGLTGFTEFTGLVKNLRIRYEAQGKIASCAIDLEGDNYSPLLARDACVLATMRAYYLDPTTNERVWTRNGVPGLWFAGFITSVQSAIDSSLEQPWAASLEGLRYVMANRLVDAHSWGNLNIAKGKNVTSGYPSATPAQIVSLLGSGEFSGTQVSTAVENVIDGFRHGPPFISSKVPTSWPTTTSIGHTSVAYFTEVFNAAPIGYDNTYDWFELTANANADCPWTSYDGYHIIAKGQGWAHKYGENSDNIYWWWKEHVAPAYGPALPMLPDYALGKGESIIFCYDKNKFFELFDQGQATQVVEWRHIPGWENFHLDGEGYLALALSRNANGAIKDMVVWSNRADPNTYTPTFPGDPATATSGQYNYLGWPVWASRPNTVNWKSSAIDTRAQAPGQSLSRYTVAGQTYLVGDDSDTAADWQLCDFPTPGFQAHKSDDMDWVVLNLGDPECVTSSLYTAGENVINMLATRGLPDRLDQNSICWAFFEAGQMFLYTGRTKTQLTGVKWFGSPAPYTVAPESPVYAVDMPRALVKAAYSGGGIMQVGLGHLMPTPTGAEPACDNTGETFTYTGVTATTLTGVVMTGTPGYVIPQNNHVYAYTKGVKLNGWRVGRIDVHRRPGLPTIQAGALYASRSIGTLLQPDAPAPDPEGQPPQPPWWWTDWEVFKTPKHDHFFATNPQHQAGGLIRFDFHPYYPTPDQYRMRQILLAVHQMTDGGYTRINEIEVFSDDILYGDSPIATATIGITLEHILVHESGIPEAKIDSGSTDIRTLVRDQSTSRASVLAIIDELCRMYGVVLVEAPDMGLFVKRDPWWPTQGEAIEPIVELPGIVAFSEEQSHYDLLGQIRVQCRDGHGALSYVGVYPPVAGPGDILEHPGTYVVSGQNDANELAQAFFRQQYKSRNATAVIAGIGMWLRPFMRVSIPNIAWGGSGWILSQDSMNWGSEWFRPPIYIVTGVEHTVKLPVIGKDGAYEPEYWETIVHLVRVEDGNNSDTVLPRPWHEEMPGVIGEPPVIP